MNTDLKSILKLLLPEFLVENFEIKKVTEVSTRVDIYLEENKALPDEFDDSKFISHGFHNEVKIKDFPIRAKQVNLYVKKRRWLNKETKEVVSRNWNIVADGTRMTKEFADFLKGFN